MGEFCVRNKSSTHDVVSESRPYLKLIEEAFGFPADLARKDEFHAFDLTHFLGGEERADEVFQILSRLQGSYAQHVRRIEGEFRIRGIRCGIGSEERDRNLRRIRSVLRNDVAFGRLRNGYDLIGTGYRKTEEEPESERIEKSVQFRKHDGREIENSDH